MRVQVIREMQFLHRAIPGIQQGCQACQCCRRGVKAYGRVEASSAYDGSNLLRRFARGCVRERRPSVTQQLEDRLSSSFHRCEVFFLFYCRSSIQPIYPTTAYLYSAQSLATHWHHTSIQHSSVFTRHIDTSAIPIPIFFLLYFCSISSNPAFVCLYSAHLYFSFPFYFLLHNVLYRYQTIVCL